MNNKLLDLDYNFTKKISKAYILTIANDEKRIQPCVDSLEKHGIAYELFPGFDGTGEEIAVPEHLKNAAYIKWIKVLDHTLNKREIACALGHISLWAHCLTINKPIAILEDDSIAYKPLPECLSNVSSIDYLGHADDLEYLKVIIKAKNQEQIFNALQNTDTSPYFKSPNLQMINRNFAFMRQAHAYAISPLTAKKLMSYVLEHGLVNPLDVLIRVGLFSISKQDFFVATSQSSQLLTQIGHNNERKSSPNIPGVI